MLDSQPRPRALLNAVERIAGGYATEHKRTEQDLALAETQLADYQTRLGKPFEHEQYLKELEALRDRLRMSLSGKPAEGEPGALELRANSSGFSRSVFWMNNVTGPEDRVSAV